MRMEFTKPENIKIGARIAAIRAEKRLSQAELGRLMGIIGDSSANSIISKLERGEAVGAKKVVMAAKALGCSTDYLFGLSTDSSCDESQNHPRAAPVTDMAEAGRLLRKIESLETSIENINKLVKKVEAERDAAKEEAKTAMRLRDNEASGA